jgi:D-alanine-D-alanine ligase
MKIAVLKGGRSLERTVSLRSGAQAQDALRRLGHEVVPIDVGPELVAQLHEARPQAAFIALHGRDGEDGTVQALLETIDIPYTGSGPAACQGCTDKALAKRLLRAAGIPTPDFHSLRQDSFKELGAAGALPDIERALGFPVVVKPASGGSALGVKFAHSSEELPRALVGAFSYDGKVVIERYVKGRDLAVSVLAGAAQASNAGEAPAEGTDEHSHAGGEPVAGTRTRPAEAAGGGEPARRAPWGSGGEPVALPVIEAIPREEDFYNYESRYEIGMTTFVCPAELPAETTARAQELALEAFRLLGCHGVARVDMMLDDASGELLVLECNVVPGLTETSLLPLAASAVEMDFDELVARILQSAFTNRPRRSPPGRPGRGTP